MALTKLGTYGPFGAHAQSVSHAHVHLLSTEGIVGEQMYMRVTYALGMSPKWTIGAQLGQGQTQTDTKISTSGVDSAGETKQYVLATIKTDVELPFGLHDIKSKNWLEAEQLSSKISGLTNCVY